jgi:hypothetical protein
MFSIAGMINRHCLRKWVIIFRICIMVGGELKDIQIFTIKIYVVYRFPSTSFDGYEYLWTRDHCVRWSSKIMSLCFSPKMEKHRLSHGAKRGRTLKVSPPMDFKSVAFGFPARS